jgi:hypothetical protein
VNFALNAEIILRYLDANTIINILLGIVLIIISFIYQKRLLRSYFR